MKSFWIGMIASALVLSASGAVTGHDHADQQARASMVLIGTIVIKPDGSVAGYTVDHADKVAHGALVALANAVPHWKFQPVLRDGKAVTAKSFMSVRLVADPLGAHRYRISIVGAHFGAGKSNATLSWKHRVTPRYPWIGAEGTVYLLVEVGRDGRVEHAAAQQVDLRTEGTPEAMKRWRKELADASRKAVMQSTFNVPVEGPESHQAHWFAMIPCNFILIRNYLRRRPPSHYGTWVSYIPGPQQFIPWASDQQAARYADAVPANGGAFPLRQSLRLLTPLGGSG